MGIFDKKQNVSRRELGKVLRTSRIIPGTGGKKYSQQEIGKLEKGTFQPKYGSQISRGDYKSAVRSLESARRKARTSLERSRLEKDIRYLKNKE